MDRGRTFLEFFAGGGMARAGLEQAGWSCVFANDFDFKKGSTYARNWGVDGVAQELLVEDIRKVDPTGLPKADLAWASFPCQDLSLAGGGAGLRGERSGTFYPFWSILSALAMEDRAPKIVVLENVTGTLTSHQGKDFAAIAQTFTDAGYKYGALIIDAARFVPQSRPRLFVIGVHADVEIAEHLVSGSPVEPFHTRGLQRAVAGISRKARESWCWWNLPIPSDRKQSFIDIIEDDPSSVDWHTAEQTDALIAMMSEINLAKVRAAKNAGRRVVGGVYKRTRVEDGVKVQRAEVRFDDVAGCLRTPSGGSSRQLILVVQGKQVRSRLVSSRETARLMGLHDSYVLPERYNEAYHLTGDGVVVPVVRFLAEHLLTPLIGEVLISSGSKEAA